MTLHSTHTSGRSSTSDPIALNMAFTDGQTCKETFSKIKGTIIIENYEQIIHEPNYLKKKTPLFI